MATQKTTGKSTKAQASKAQYPITRYKNPDIQTAFNGRAEITPDGAQFRVTFIDRHGEQNERMTTLAKAMSYVAECGFTLETPPAKASRKSAASPEAVKAMMEQASAALTGALDDDATRVCEKHGAVYIDYCAQCVAEREAQAEHAAQAHQVFAEIQAIQALQAGKSELAQAVDLAVAELQSTPPVETVEVAAPVATPAKPEKPAKSAKAPKAEKPEKPAESAETVEAFRVAPAQSEIEKVGAVIREALGSKYPRELAALMAATPQGYAGLRRLVAVLGDIYERQTLDAEIRDAAAALAKVLDSGSISEPLTAYLLRFRLENIHNMVAETYLTIKAHGVTAQQILEGYTLTLSTHAMKDGGFFYVRNYHRAK